MRARGRRPVSIGRQFTLVRELRGLSQREAAALTNGEIGSSGLSRIEAGERTNPSLNTLRALARVYGVWIHVSPEGEIEVTENS